MKTLEYISQELVKAINTNKPNLKIEYNRILLSTKTTQVVIPKQANSLRSSSRSRSV